MKKGDIKVNAFLNTAKTVLGIIFPLITFTNCVVRERDLLLI